MRLGAQSADEPTIESIQVEHFAQCSLCRRSLWQYSLINLGQLGLVEHMSYIKKVDHITYACEAGTIERWAWFHIEVEGGTLINRIDDVRPGDPDSSMKIWCIDYGDFGVALIEGIDRAKKSQVTKFVEKHGDHSCQHVAFDTHDLDKFLDHMQSMGGSPRGQVLVRNDGFGMLKQVFARGYTEGDAAETNFPEYC